MSEKQNIFQIWRENGEKLPFKARIDSWSESLGHFALIEKIEIGKWPYGEAHGQYFFHGVPGEKSEIRNAGTYRWTLIE
jgi:hypothetical protein